VGNKLEGQGWWEVKAEKKKKARGKEGDQEGVIQEKTGNIFQSPFLNLHNHETVRSVHALSSPALA
jgi:hypothetical protein